MVFHKNQAVNIKLAAFFWGGQGKGHGCPLIRFTLIARLRLEAYTKAQISLLVAYYSLLSLVLAIIIPSPLLRLEAYTLNNWGRSPTLYTHLW